MLGQGRTYFSPNMKKSRLKPSFIDIDVRVRTVLKYTKFASR